MKTFLIMRHGKSSWKDPNLADNERPLKKRGRKDSARIGALLKDQKLVPDIIICSTAKRAKQTAKIIIDELNYEGHIEYLESLYMAEPEAIFQALQSLPDVEAVMLIGHNPGLETLLQILSDGINSLPTAALAKVTLPINEWRQLNMDVSGVLDALWLPRELN